MHRCAPSVRIVTASLRLCLCFVLFLLAAGPSVAQVLGSGSIVGQVTDEGRGLLPGVMVTATSSALQVRNVTTVTDDRGEYRLASLPIGTYDVAYELPGFRTIVRKDVRLELDFTARLDIVLAVGGVEETLTVVGGAPVVDVTSTGARTQLTREALTLIPRGGDGYIGLMQLLPELLERPARSLRIWTLGVSCRELHVLVKTDGGERRVQVFRSNVGVEQRHHVGIANAARAHHKVAPSPLAQLEILHLV